MAFIVFLWHYLYLAIYNQQSARKQRHEKNFKNYIKPVYYSYYYLYATYFTGEVRAKPGYASVPLYYLNYVQIVELYKSLCVECIKKRKRPTMKGVVVKPIISNDYGSRGQVDLIDMQSMPSRDNKWIMVYQVTLYN